MSAHEPLRFKLTGESALLMHNGLLADPLYPHSKSIAELASKSSKTEADFDRIAELEFLGGLYVSDGAPCIPAEMLEAALVRAAGQGRRGSKAKVKAGILVRDNARLDYDGPRNPDELWKDPRFRLRSVVRIGMSKVVRTRPMFPVWSAEVVIGYLPNLLNAADVRGFLVTAGEQVGIGDWRPRFGRFSLVDGPSPKRGKAG